MHNFIDLIHSQLARFGIVIQFQKSRSCLISRLLVSRAPSRFFRQNFKHSRQRQRVKQPGWSSSVPVLLEDAPLFIRGSHFPRKRSIQRRRKRNRSSLVIPLFILALFYRLTFFLHGEFLLLSFLFVLLFSRLL